MSTLPRLLRERRAVNATVLDAALAVVLTAWVLAEPNARPSPAQALVAVVMTGATAWSRRAPAAVLGVEIAGLAVATSTLSLPQGIAVLVAAYSAAFHSDRRLIVAVLLLAAAAWLFAFGSEARVPSGLVPVLLVAPVWVSGSAMRRREQRAELSRQRAERLERERKAAVRAERVRIARELHDVVTHSVSVMVLQSGAAREIMTRDEPRSQALLQSVERSGRQALDELRRLLGLLSDDDEETPLAPQPGVGEIPSLIEKLREAGLTVELCVEGEASTTTGGVGVAAYRVVQEALTNVLKHAGGAPTRVFLRWQEAALELEILDRGTSLEHPPRDATPGRGLAGMRARTAIYGGTLYAGARPDGGYMVRARIPLQPHSA